MIEKEEKASREDSEQIELEINRKEEETSREDSVIRIESEINRRSGLILSQMFGNPSWNVNVVFSRGGGLGTPP